MVQQSIVDSYVPHEETTILTQPVPSSEPEDVLCSQISGEPIDLTMSQVSLSNKTLIISNIVPMVEQCDNSGYFPVTNATICEHPGRVIINVESTQKFLLMK